MADVDTVWVVLGLVVLGGTLLDVFLTALNYDESGFVSGRVSALQWRAARQVTRRLPRRWRPVALRQVTGLQIVVLVAVWLFGVILGFGLVYYGQMSRRAFSGSGPDAPLDLFGAMYFSAAQLSTVGGSYLTAQTDLLRFLSIAETLTGVILVSLILTFLLGVYSVISDLNALCRHFVAAERGAGSAVAGLAPYFHDGQASGLDGHLDGIAASFASYTDGLRLHHAAYYFQSGRDRFALPYALRMLGGTIGALRWGLPAGHPAAAEPALVPLTFQLLEFGDYLQTTLRWRSLDVPEVVDRDTFVAQVRATGPGAERDEWVVRFVDLDRRMADLAGTTPLADPDEAYRRYAAWLPFAYRSQQITLAVSRDLDYQPVIVTDHPVSVLRRAEPVALGALEGVPVGPDPSPAPSAEPEPRRVVSRWRRFADRRLSLVDPGYARLRSAARAVLAAAGAVLSLFVVLDAAGVHARQPALYAGFVAMLSSGIAADATVRARKVTSVLVVVPVAAVVLLGAVVARSAAWTAVLVVAVAFAGTAAGRFGARWAALGQATFMAYYFTLILRLQPADVGLYVVAALTGILWAYLLTYVVLPGRPRRVLRGGMDAFARHLVVALDALVDAVSWARWDPDVRKRVAQDSRQLQRGAAFLGGRLAGPADATGIAPARAAELRLRLFDTELAGAALATAARDVTGTAVPLELRGRLAGRLQLLQAHLAALAADPVGDGGPGRPSALGGHGGHGGHGEPGGSGGPVAPLIDPWPTDPPPAHWPPAARALHRAADEMYRSAVALRAAEAAALDPASPAPAGGDPEDTGPDAVGLEQLDGLVTTPPGSAARSRLSPVTRRAVQAAVATGAALGVGELLSSTHQYWATLAAYQVLGGTDGETLVKGTQRVVGTVAGALVGFGVALATDADMAVVVPLLAVTVFASTFTRPVSPARSTFWRTMMFALIYESLGRLTSLALELRVLETVLGAAAALLVAWRVLPTHTRAELDRDAAAVVRDVDVVVTASLARAGGDGTVPRRAIQDRLLQLDRDVRAVGVTAQPLRRSSGALEPGGVEARLTAYWSLAADTRHLARAAERAVAAGVDLDSPAWAQARQATRRNLAALSGVLRGDATPVVEETLDFVGPGPEADGASAGPAAGAERDVLRELRRINLTLLVLVQDAVPGAAPRHGDDARRDAREHRGAGV